MTPLIEILGEFQLEFDEGRVEEISASLSGQWLWDWPDTVYTRIVWQYRRDRAVLTDGIVGRLRVGP